MSNPLKVFITYSRRDEEAKDKLITHFAVMLRQRLIEIWHDNEIYGGDRWQEEIFSRHLPSSNMLLYLVSANSLASEDCRRELEIALSREIRVIPIILAACDWENDRLSDFQSFPNNGTPINEWEPEDPGWKDVVEGIREVVGEMQPQTDPGPNISEERLQAETLFGNGNILVTLGQLDDAIRVYSRAIDLNLNHAKVYNNRGVVYADKGEFDKAVQDYDAAINLDPQHARAYTNRGTAYHNKGDFDRAIKDHNTAIELNRQYVSAYNNRGVAYQRKDDLDRAIEDFNTAIGLNPECAEVYNNRGLAYSKKGDLDRAIKDHNTAIELNRQYASAYNNRGVAYQRKDDLDRAIEDFNTAIGLNPERAEAYTNRGEAWLHLKEWEKAKTDLIAAKGMGVDIVASFHNDYESVADFEAKRGVKVPEDIAALLRAR